MKRRHTPHKRIYTGKITGVRGFRVRANHARPGPHQSSLNQRRPNWAPKSTSSPSFIVGTLNFHRTPVRQNIGRENDYPGQQEALVSDRMPADRRGAIHDTLYKNLLRISMDSDYLKNLLSTHKNSAPTAAVGGLEPGHFEELWTPENIQKTLAEFLTACARKTGMERILAIRRHIGEIHYSQKTISVELNLGCRSEHASVDSSRPSDGKRQASSRPPAAALRAEHESFDSVRPNDSKSIPPAPKKKGSDLGNRSDPLHEFESSMKWCSVQDSNL